MEVGGMSNEPGRVGQHTFAVWEFERLFHRIIPEFLIIQAFEILVLHATVAKGIGGRWQAVEDRVIVVVAVCKGGYSEGGSPLSDRFFPEVHVPQEFPFGFHAGDADLFLGFEVFFVISNDLLRVGFPVGVFDLVIHFCPLVDDLTASSIVVFVVDKELFCSEQVLENILILLQIPLHDTISFVHKEARRACCATGWVLVISVTSRQILKYTSCHWVSKELSKKTYQLGVRGFTGLHIFAAKSRVNRPLESFLVG